MTGVVGRDRELACLQERAAAARAGQGSVVLLAGEAGVGKTALARDALARTGLAVLESAAVPGGPAFGPVVEVLRAHLRAGGALVEGPLRPRLALLLPELGPAVGGDRATLHEAVRRSLSDIAQRAPTAIFLDDLQWADAATLELLPALTCLFDGGRLLIVGAYRSDQLPATTRCGGCGVRCAARGGSSTSGWTRWTSPGPPGC